MNLTPWFNAKEGNWPARSGLYQVANTNVVAFSKSGDPYGWVYQWFESKTQSWTPWKKWGFYPANTIGAWRGIEKGLS